MRVLFHFRSSLLASRGTPLRSRNLARWLAQQPGVDVAVLSRDPDSSEVQSLLQTDHLPIPPAEDALPALAAAVQRLVPQVVYGQTHKGALDLARLPRRGRPLLIADLHGDPAWEKLEDGQRTPLRRVKGFVSSRLGERRAFPRLDGFTVVSEMLLRRVARFGKPAMLLLGGVDSELFQAAPPVVRDRITVGYAGSFRSYHGIDDLVRAASMLIARGEPYHFLMVGDLSVSAGLGERIRRSLGEHATLLDPVAHDRVAKILAGCDILAVPRRSGRAAAYNYPSKLSEYLALGRAVVVTDVGQAGRVAAQSEAAVTVSPGDPEALAGALLRLEDPEMRRRLGRRARQYAVDHLAWNHIAASLADFLRRIPAARSDI